MTTKNGNMRKRIIDAMIADVDAIPGRAGETPISDLANMLSKLKDSKAREAIKTITDLINEPPCPLPLDNPDRYWVIMSFLSHYPKGDRSTIKKAFFDRLFGEGALPRSLQVRALQGYIGGGSVLDESQLIALSYLVDDAPVLWLEAAVESKLFKFAKENTIQLLRDRKILAKDLIFALSYWKEHWPTDEDFSQLVEEFHNAVSDPDTKEKLREWIYRRKPH